MSAYLRLGFAGLVHDHVWDLAPQWRETGVELVAAADPNQPPRARMESEFGVARTYETIPEMIAAEELDIVQVTTANADHADAVEAAAAAGAHCLVEKPMAATLEQADRMLAAAEQAGTRLMINWPITWQPIYKKMREVAASGAIGRVLQVKHRGGHSGPRSFGCSEYFTDWLYDAERNGAGAFMDYSGYGVNIVLDYLSDATAVYAHAANLAQSADPVDDNGLMIVKFANEMALVESTWTEQGAIPWNTFVLGESGALMADHRSCDLVQFDRANRAGTPVECDPMPLGYRNAPEYFVGRLLADTPIEEPSTAERGRAVQEILQAGLDSIADNREVALPLS
ncbi:MAG TPA: Gfo/Idh/MocA family oxidoreductase [Chloroflexota bacterium]|nr:Gfo/Idh/MocA family oxidoreductase [Chloroflexota bacterium]